jgi:hypothetical protein
MKTIALLTLSWVMSVTAAHAAILILDQNTNAPGNTYATFTDAQTAAADNDTILVIPSTSSYSNISITKPLTILGVGFNPDKEIFTTSSFGTITINNGLSGVKIIGITANTINLGSVSGSQVSNIIIENSKVSSITTPMNNNGALSNVIIRQNVIEQTSQFSYPISLRAGNQSNILVINNIFSSTQSLTTWYGPQVSTGGVTFDHNLFLGGGSQIAFVELRNCLVSNNIFYGESPTAVSNNLENVVFKNNISPTFDFTTIIGTNVTIEGNLSNTDPAFEDLPLNTFQFDFTMDPALQVGSPAIGAATDGTDLGIYGGTSPYKNTGSVLPVVKQFTVPSNIQEGSNANADIIVTGN